MPWCGCATTGSDSGKAARAATNPDLNAAIKQAEAKLAEVKVGEEVSGDILRDRKPQIQINVGLFHTFKPFTTLRVLYWSRRTQQYKLLVFEHQRSIVFFKSMYYLSKPVERRPKTFCLNDEGQSAVDLRKQNINDGLIEKMLKEFYPHAGEFEL